MPVLSRLRAISAARPSVGLIAVAWLATAAGAGAAEKVEPIKGAADYVAASYGQLDRSLNQLTGKTATLCDGPSESQLATVRTAFKSAVQDWGRVELVQFGPIREKNRLERMLFWPDRKGIGLKQAQAAIADESPDLLDASALPGKSIAVQGLGALEYLLFGADSDDLAAAKPGSFRCRYAQALASGASTIIKEVNAEWPAFAKSWENPGPDNKLFRSRDESMTALLNVFVHGLEQVRDQRLGAFLGDAPDKDKPKQAILWRSTSTLPLLVANIDSLRALFAKSGFDPENSGVDNGLLTGDNAYLGESITFEFNNAVNALSALSDKSLEAVLAEPALRKKLSYFGIVTSSLTEDFGVRLSGALGITAGFSSLDGD